MSVAKMQRLTQGDRLDALERRADGHDKMAQQVQELYDLYTTAKTIFGAVSWFWVKIVGFGGAFLGLVAVATTIWVNLGKLLGH